MIKNNILSKYIQNLKYIKNNFIIKCNVIKKKKKNGEKITILDILNEFKFIDSKKYIKNTSHNNSGSLKEKNKKSKSDSNVKLKIMLKNTLIASTLVVVSLGFSFFIFEQTDVMSFIKITEESENKILNVLKSPKTNVYIKSFYIKDIDDIDYYANVVDNLDSYSYRIKLDDVSDDLKNELLLNNYKNTSSIKTLNDIELSSIIEYNDKYLISNKYNIDKNKIDKHNLEMLNSNIKIQTINSFNNLKALIISSITLILSIVSNILYFYTKKVISKK